MILKIDTTHGHDVEIKILDNKKNIIQKKFHAEYAQAEKLLPAIIEMFKKEKIRLEDVKKIKVENRGGGFTALRIGVITANALGYSLNIPVEPVLGQAKKVGKISIIEPKYDKEPNITTPKTRG
ncbi:MAG: hypothetical protein ABH881_01855 [bacterium]